MARPKHHAWDRPAFSTRWFSRCCCGLPCWWWRRCSSTRFTPCC